MILEFQNSREDYFQYYKFSFIAHLRRSLWRRILFYLILSILAGFFSGTDFSTSMSLTITMLAFAGCILFSIIFMLITFMLIPYILLTVNEKQYLDRKRIITTDAGFSLESASKIRLFGWGEVYSVESDDRYVYLYTAKSKYFARKRAIIIPKGTFNQTQELDNFLHIVQQHLK